MLRYREKGVCDKLVQSGCINAKIKDKWYQKVWVGNGVRVRGGVSLHSVEVDVLTGTDFTNASGRAIEHSILIRC